jgi:glycosyltransferase involved in cell wall biosynthesis
LSIQVEMEKSPAPAVSGAAHARTLLSINNYYYPRGGAESLFLEQNRMLQKDGWDVVPFSMEHPKNLASPWSGHFIKELEFGENYSVLGKVVRAQKALYSFESRRNLERLIRQVNPAIAHAHNIYHHLSPAILDSLKKYNIPTVLTLHDLKLACPAYKMFTHDGICERCKNGRIWNVVTNKCIKGSVALSGLVMLESALYRALGSYLNNLDAIIVPSKFYLEKLVEWGWPRERFTHIPNFVDTDKFVPNDAVGRAFVFFGRLGPEKGIGTFIRAVGLAKAKGIVIGSGPEEARLKALAADTGADISFVSHCTGEELMRMVQLARATVLPSEWYENAPMSVMESYALGRPVIGADIGGIPELIRPDETGWLFPAKDPERLAALMRRVQDLPDSVVAAMGANGRQWMEAEFSRSTYRRRLLSLYDAILE